MALITQAPAELSPDLLPVAEAAGTFMQAARAPSTRAAYEADWRTFSRWCEQSGLEAALPIAPRVVELFAAAMAENGLRPATITRRLTSISIRHRDASLDSPCAHDGVKRILKGIKRELGTTPRRVSPLTDTDLRKIVENLTDCRLADTRDRALMLVGWAGFLRRSEIAKLDLEDVEWVVDGALLHVRESKTNKGGEAEVVGLPWGSQNTSCPVRTLRAWIERAGIEGGPLFVAIDRHGNMGGRMSGAAIASLIKRRVAAAGLDSRAFSGHSLRSGAATSSAIAGAPVFSIQRAGRWKSVQMLNSYVRSRDVFDRHAIGYTGI